MARLLSWLGRPALLRSLLSRVRLAARLLREPLTPLTVKALAALPILYVISPVDLLPDLIPVLGQLDDIGVVLMAIEGFLGLVPSHLVDFHRRALEEGRPYTPLGKGTAAAGDGAVIDAEWRREDEPRPSGPPDVSRR
jgi:uncharacterized membrane protein YkvA (DUF1232 family)